jgi:hypothetical protein
MNMWFERISNVERQCEGDYPMATIQGIYVAIFGRPVDPAGLVHWNTETNNGADLSSMIGALSASDEFKALYDGKSNTEVITAIYQALFGRAPEQAGLDFFLAGLENGTLSIESIAISILDGAQGTDKTIVDNKITAADAFTAQLDLQTEVDAYAGTSAADVGRGYLAPITADPATIPTTESTDATILTLFNPDGGQAPVVGGGGGGGGGAPVGDVTAPVFTSADAITINENLTDAITVMATDAAAVSYSIVGGADQALFSIDPASGKLTFNTAPDFENPTDDGNDNVYDVQVAATDVSLNAGTQNIAVTVADVAELIVDGAAGDDTTPGTAGYKTINAAIAAANAGDQIIIKGTATYAENVILDRSVSLIEDPTSLGVKIAPATGNAITVKPGLSGAIVVSGIDLEGVGNSLNQHGIHIEAGAALDSFIFEKGTISDFGQYGVWATDGHVEAGATPTVGNLIIRDSAFTDNGLGTGNPDSQIKLFGFSGKVELINLTITAGSTANKAIEFTGGLTSNGNANTFDGSDVMPSADVLISNVSVAGDYARNPVSFNNYLDVENVSINGLDLSGASSATWSLLNFDSVGGGTMNAPGFGIVFPVGYAGADKVVEFQGANPSQPDSPITINSIDVSGVSAGAYAFVRGGSGNDTLNGSAGREFIQGKLGNDEINGGAGNDIIWGDGPNVTTALTANFGDDVIDGGLGTNVIVLGTKAQDIQLGGQDTVQMVRGAQGDDVIFNFNFGPTDRFDDITAGGGVGAGTTTPRPATQDDLTFDILKGSGYTNLQQFLDNVTIKIGNDNSAYLDKVDTALGSTPGVAGNTISAPHGDIYSGPAAGNEFEIVLDFADGGSITFANAMSRWEKFKFLTALSDPSYSLTSPSGGGVTEDATLNAFTYAGGDTTDPTGALVTLTDAQEAALIGVLRFEGNLVLDGVV